jgi:DNA-binding beta-propeller fold protein YncE
MPIHYEPIRAHRCRGVPDRFEFAPNRQADYLNVFDLSEGRWIKTIQVGRRPDVTATTADRRYLYVAGESLCAIDLETLAVVREIHGEGIQAHYALNLFPDGERMFLFNYDGSIVVLNQVDDPRRAVVERVIRVNPPEQPEAAVGGKGHFTTDGTRYINPNWHTGTIFAIELTRGYALTTLVKGGLDRPDDLVMSADERKGYTASHGSRPGAPGAVHVFDPASGQVIKAIAVGRKPAGLTMSPDKRVVYATNVPDGSITAIDARTDEALFTASAAECYRAAGITGDHLDIEGVTTSADGKTLYAYAVNYGALVIFDDLGGENRPRLLRGPT